MNNDAKRVARVAADTKWPGLTVRYRGYSVTEVVVDGEIVKGTYAEEIVAAFDARLLAEGRVTSALYDVRGARNETL